ncbi:hypothetical protein BRADI_3g07196v3 [Brachypodium distachyon]|uniref:Uncharacterized protein n=1 Tax=Brachypodium distachyon TaxID=15368 RepID=A0A2K2CVP8_BRADI|nr:hypothetical protein BRADI_3g07196v3 [Brachypodium distachyon]
MVHRKLLKEVGPESPISLLIAAFELQINMLCQFVACDLVLVGGFLYHNSLACFSNLTSVQPLGSFLTVFQD